MLWSLQNRKQPIWLLVDPVEDSRMSCLGPSEQFLQHQACKFVASFSVDLRGHV